MKTSPRCILVLVLTTGCSSGSKAPEEPPKPKLTLAQAIDLHRGAATEKLTAILEIGKQARDRKPLESDTLKPVADQPLLCSNGQYVGRPAKERKRWVDCNAEVLYAHSILSKSPAGAGKGPDPQKHVYMGDDGLTRVHRLLTKGKVSNKYEPKSDSDYHAIHPDWVGDPFARFSNLRFLFIIVPRPTSGGKRFEADVHLYDLKQKSWLGGFPVKEKGKITHYEYVTGPSKGHSAGSTNSVKGMVYETIAGTIEKHYPSEGGSARTRWINTVGLIKY
jgi:hypothetical protein